MKLERQSSRLPLSLAVEYRTASAFLVAYSVNLSTGGMFIETSTALAIGTSLALRFAIPGAQPVDLAAVVVWVRETPEEGRPAGMGIRFTEPLEVRYGQLIDQLANDFRGLRVVVVAATASAREVLARGVKSMLTSASVVEASDSVAAEEGFQADADLALIDLDDMGPEGLVALRLAKVGRRPIPVLVLARADEDRRRAGELEADEILPSTPPLPDLQLAVFRALSKPARVG